MTPREFEITLSDAEVQLSRLKHLYEQWFQGVERLEPTIPRKQFDRILHELRKGQPRNTYLRFRFNTLIQRYTTLQTYWRRVSRQIEEGSYRRDLMRARRRREQARSARQAERKAQRVGSDPVELDPDANVDANALIAEASDCVDGYIQQSKERDSAGGANGAGTPDGTPKRTSGGRPRSIPSQKPATNGQPDTARFGRPKSSWPAVVDHRPAKVSETTRRPKLGSPPPPQSTPKTPPPLPLRSKGPGDARLRQIYESYVRAKEQNNEPTSKIDYETVAKSIKKMVPKLDRKHKGKRIDFKIVVQDGKVGLKPIVKK